MEGKIGLREAADMLGLSPATTKKLVQTGQLRALYERGPGYHRDPAFDPAEVADLVELRARGMSVADLAGIAHAAAVRSASVERRLDRLLELLGVDIPVLDRSEQAVLSLIEEMSDLLAAQHIYLDADETMRWARTFYSMGEEYLDLVARYTGDSEPWRLPLELAARLMSLKVDGDAELQQSQRHLAVGRRFLRQAAYFYVRTREGARAAGRLFPETLDVNRQILSIAMQPSRCENEG